MAKAELKTKANDASVDDFINSLSDEQQRTDTKVVVDLMGKITKEKPKMWGKAIVGFGIVQLKYASGRDLEWLRMGFSPRKNALTFYGLKYYDNKEDELFSKLGKYTEGKGCVYIKRLKDIDLDILKKIIEKAYLNKSIADHIK